MIANLTAVFQLDNLWQIIHPIQQLRNLTKLKMLMEELKVPKVRRMRVKRKTREKLKIRMNVTSLLTLLRSKKANV